MIGVLLVGHNSITDGFLSACDMIYGHHNHCQKVALTEGVVSFQDELYGTLDNMFEEYDGVMVLADVKGGTPFNQSLHYKLEKNKDNMAIISGVNLPMLLEMLPRLETTDDLASFAKEMAAIGQQSVLLELVDDHADEENSSDPDDVI